MKKLRYFSLVYLFIILSFGKSYSQKSSTVSLKQVIDEKAINSWSRLGNSKTWQISNDGKYLFYQINTGKSTDSLFLQSINGKWIKKLVRSKSITPSFSSTGRFFIYKDLTNCLIAIECGTKKEQKMPYVSDLEVLGFNDFLLYKIEFKSTLIIKNLSTGVEKKISNVLNYSFSNDSHCLAVCISTNNELKQQKLFVLNLESGESSEAYKGDKIDNIKFGPKGTQLAFQSISRSGEALFWLYNIGTKHCANLFSLSEINLDTNENIFSIDGFSRDYRSIYLTLSRKVPEIDRPDNSLVSIWAYTDVALPNEPQYGRDISKKHSKAIYLIGAEKLIKLDTTGEEAQLLPDDWWLISKKSEKLANSNSSEKGLWESSEKKLNLICGIDGSVHSLLNFNGALSGDNISPDRKHIVYFDFLDNLYKSYSLIDGSLVNISQNIPLERYKYGVLEKSLDYNRSLFPIKWNVDGTKCYIYDHYDIWVLDPSGSQKSYSLTNGYGRKNKVVFTSLDSEYDRNFVSQNKLLSAFDEANKQNGFFKLSKSADVNPIKLVMDDVLFYDYANPLVNDKPKKAKNSDSYILQMQDSKTSPNLYFTKDFIKYQRITNIFPEREYNWPNAELINYPLGNGETGQAVLYKPEDFDATKKYPVIFYYYENLSQELNQYLFPEFFEGPINIPWIVSRGYLVCTPDIYTLEGQPGKSAYHSVMAAANVVSKLSYVDSLSMGLQGHSMGAYKTNFIITKTNKFAAAVSASGGSNMTSEANLLWGIGQLGKGSGKTKHEYFRWGQYQMGGTLWEVPEKYIENSPIFYANNISTPLLLAIGEEDANVPPTGSLELFTSLRRLGKPVWMLQYKGSKNRHIFGSEDAKIDYTTRVVQFFDYYLKKLPAPLWLVEDNSRMDGKKSLELDKLGRTPGRHNSILSKKEKQRLEENTTKQLRERFKVLTDDKLLNK